MSTYDKIALGNKPNLYLSAPDVTDKSGTGLFSLSNNNLSPTGQPIIYGSEFSFVGDVDNTVDITGNPLFFNDTATFECVVVAGRPSEDVPLVIDDDSQNALYITPEGFTVKLFFENLLSTYAQVATVEIKDWSRKFYVVLTITSTQATLSVNGDSAVLTYSDNIIDSTNLVLAGSYTDFSYLVDGLGFYSNTITEKKSLLDDSFSGHSNYASAKYNGRTTTFSGYTPGEEKSFTLKDFVYEENIYTLTYYSADVQNGLDYLVVRSNDERVPISYDINLDDSGQFTEYLLVNSISNATIRFIIDSAEVDSSFTLRIQAVNNGDVLYETPADLVLSGLALYGNSDESIVNFPDGTKLPEATYLGSWIYSDLMTDTPKTVELAFKPVESDEDTIVFASSDGTASFGPTGSITGFTAYLNGVLVTDFADLRYDQWNHLVLVHETASATEFYLNSEDGLDTDQTISYMFLTAYSDELSEESIEILYSIVLGVDLLSFSDTATISEGTFSSGTAFNAYSYPWSIIGAGGS